MRQVLLTLMTLLLTSGLQAETPHTSTQAGHGQDAAHGLPADQVAHGAQKEGHKAAHPDEDHGSGHAAPKTYFGIPGWILQTLNMIFFVLVLVWLLKGPALGFFRGRKQAIQAQLEEATERRAKADRIVLDIDERLKSIEAEVESILQRAKEEGERQKQELLVAAEAESQKILTSARNEVDARVKQARKELSEFAGELATARAETLLEQSMTDQDRKRLFEEGVQQIAELRS